MERLDRLAFVAGEAGDDRLRHELAAEYHVVTDIDIARPVAVGPERLQRERRQRSINGEHESSIWAGSAGPRRGGCSRRSGTDCGRWTRREVRTPPAGPSAW